MVRRNWFDNEVLIQFMVKIVSEVQIISDFSPFVFETFFKSMDLRVIHSLALHFIRYF